MSQGREEKSKERQKKKRRDWRIKSKRGAGYKGRKEGTNGSDRR